MGTNNLIIDVADSDQVEVDHVNQYGLALEGDLVPRKDGTPANRAGALGSAIHQWSEVHAQSLVVDGQSLDVSAVQGERYQIISGRTFPTGPAPDFLRAQADGSVKLLAASTPLSLVINNKNIEIDTDIDFAVSAGPNTANTLNFYINYRNRGGYEGIVIGTALPENLNNKWVAFKYGVEIFFGKYVPSYYFFNPRLFLPDDYFEPGIIDVLTVGFVGRNGLIQQNLDFPASNAANLLNLGWVFIIDDKSVDVTYSRPVFSFTEPTRPSTGDYWFDARAMVYKKHNGTSFVAANAVLVGLVVSDDSGAIATKCFDFNRNYSSNPDVTINRIDDNKASLGGNSGPISVYGSAITERINADITWDMETLASKENGTNYYAYLTHEGEPLISTDRPIYLSRLKGFYSNANGNLCVGVLPTNGSGNLVYVRSLQSNDISKFRLTQEQKDANEMLSANFQIHGLISGLNYKATINVTSDVAGTYIFENDGTTALPGPSQRRISPYLFTRELAADEERTSIVTFKAETNLVWVNFSAPANGLGTVTFNIELEEFSQEDISFVTTNIEPEAS